MNNISSNLNTTKRTLHSSFQSSMGFDDYYTKIESDNKFALIGALDNYYNKEYIDAAQNLKASIEYVDNAISLAIGSVLGGEF